MAKAFLQKRWGVLLGLLLGLTSAAFLFAQVFDTKDIAATFDREAYIEYKAREFNSVNDLIRQYEADLNWWMPLALPDTDRGWWKQASFYSLSPFNPAGFTNDFVKGLVPVTREDVAVYPVSITENFFTRYREICNANGALIASVPPPARYNPRWFVYQNYPSLDAWALSESRKAEIIGIYDQARLTVKMDLILDDELITLIMRRSLLAADAQAQKAADDVLARKGGGNELAMKRSLTAASNIVVDCVSLTNGLTLQISYPNDFTNRLEIYAGSDLLADTWTLADTGLLTAGTNAIFWTDTNAIAGVKYFNVGDAQTDTDNDGLVDAREKRLYHSNPNSIDGDNDGLVDGYSGVVPTNAYPSGVTTNGGPYVEGELTWGTSPALFDTDDDGMSDGWEVAHAHNPLDGNDPPNVHGTINYSGGQTGPVIVMAVETSDSWATNHSVRLNGPGTYRIPNLTATNYWLKAFVDNNGDASNGLSEAWGVHSTSAIEITNKVAGIDISLADPDTNTNNIPDFWEIAHFGSLTNSGAGDDPDGDQYSNLEEYQAGTDPNDISNHPWNVSGTVFYTGPQTGTIWVIASPSLESWTGVRSTSIAAPGAYTITHLPPNTNYWIRAWRDTDGDNAAAYFEAYGDMAQNPVYLNGNCTNADLTLADSDSDGDGLPDWWAVRYGLNAFDGVRSDAAGWWRLDAANGTNVMDSSAYGNHGTLWNSPTNAWTEGVVSNGLRLNGTNSYVQLADSASLKPQFVSVALWLRPDRDYTNGSAAFFSKRVSGGSAGYNLGYENGKLSFTIYASGAKTVQLPCALSNNVWRHVAGTYGGQYQRLYVDGVLAVETNYFWDPGYGNIAQDATNPRLGATADASPSNHFAGTLDDLLVFGQELSSNRVFGLYQEGADFDQDGLSNWREFQTGTCPTNNDTDFDGMPDEWEVANLLAPMNPNDAGDDPDNDGLVNLDEYLNGTDPHNPDTDSDTLLDGWEVAWGFDPLHTDESNDDPDGDGFSNYDEQSLNGNPFDTAMSGEQLCWKILNYQTANSNQMMSQTLMNEPELNGMRVDVIDDDLCSERQIVTNRYAYGQLLATGYVLRITVAGVVENVDGGFDQAWVRSSYGTNTVQDQFFIQSHEGYYDEPPPMISDSATQDVIILNNGAVSLVYDTVDPLYHRGCYAQITEATVVSVLKVESITPNMGQEINDGDNNPKTRVFVVSGTNSGNVTVTANITPEIPENSMPAGITIHGGSGSGKLTRTVSRTTPSKTVFTYDLCGADSGLRTTLYVCDAKVYLYADEGQRSWNTQYPYFTFNVGHSWWRLELSPETIEVLPFGLDYPFLSTNTGYWPMNSENLKPLTNYEDDGVVWFGDNGDGGHTPTGSHCWHIQFDKLISALEWVQSRALNPGTYNLYNQNCTTETCEVGTHAGVSCDYITPWNFSDWLKQQ